MNADSPYNLDAAQLENAVQALQKAAATLQPSLGEARLYRILGVCLWIAVAGLLATIIAVSTGTAVELIGLFGIIFLLAAVSAPVFLLLNFSLVRQAFRQWQLLKKLGIREVSLSAWRQDRKSFRWSRLAGAALTTAGILTLVIGLLAWFGRKKDDAVMIWVVLLLFAFGITVLVWRFVQRSRQQLALVANANRLRATLESMKTKAGSGEAIAIPAALLEDVARIERVQIARERRDAVVASSGTTSRGYGVLVARDVAVQKSMLDSGQRVAVEDLIDELSANPRVASTAPTADNLMRIAIPGGGVELQYQIDEGARRVHIVGLHSKEPTQKGGGPD
jgi:hypothetical protein